MEIVLAVEEVERLGHVHQPAAERAGGNGPGSPPGRVIHAVPQAPSREILHDHVGTPVFRPHVEDLEDVRVAQVHQRADLEVESLEKTRPGVVRVLDYGTLDHDIGLQVTIVGAIDLSHAPGAELRQDLVPASGDPTTDPIMRHAI